MVDIQDHSVQKEVLKSQSLLRTRVWEVVADTFSLTHKSAAITREYLKHPGAVAIFALNEQEEVLIIKQYRHPIRREEWEVPAGLLDVEGEDLLSAAERELYEEADMKAKKWSVLLDFFTSPGGSDEAIRIYLAQDLSDVPFEKRFKRFDEEAQIEPRWISLEELTEAVMKGRVHNPILCLGAMTLHHVLRAGKGATLAPATTTFTLRSSF